MKTFLTPHLLRFSFIAIVLTLLFRFSLSSAITNSYTIAVILSAIFYALLMAVNGAYFGKKDYEYLPIYDIGFRFHLASFVTHFMVTFLWFGFNLKSIYEHINVIYIYGLIWLGFLVIHGIYYLHNKKNTIKDLNSNEIFE